MPRLLLLAALLVACSAPSAAPLLSDRVSHGLQVDFALCRETPGPNAPTYDGNLWTFGPGSTPLRCSLAIEWQDYVTAYTVHGQHDAGPVTSTACLQLLEITTPDAVPGDIAPCTRPVTSGPGTLTLQGVLPAPGFGVSEDFTLSLQIHGAGGDRFGGAWVEVARLH